MRTSWKRVAVAVGLLLAAACGGEPGSAAAGAGGRTSPASTPTAPFLPALGVNAPVAPGTYRFTAQDNEPAQVARATIAVPPGFDSNSSWYVVSPDGHEYLGLWTVGLVYTDPCHRGKSASVRPGPSVRDLADALVAQRATRASIPRPVTVGGHRGLYLELRSPADMSRCVALAEADLWGDPGGRGIYGDGQVDLVWIVDVAGQRLVVNAAYSAARSAPSSAADVRKLRSMVESLRWLPTPQG